MSIYLQVIYPPLFADIAGWKTDPVFQSMYFLWRNGDIPTKTGDFPIKNGDFPMKNHDDFGPCYVIIYHLGFWIFRGRAVEGNRGGDAGDPRKPIRVPRQNPLPGREEKSIQILGIGMLS